MGLSLALHAVGDGAAHTAAVLAEDAYGCAGVAAGQVHASTHHAAAQRPGLPAACLPF